MASSPVSVKAGCQKVISSESLHTVAVGSVAATLQNELMDAIKALDLFEARKALTKIVQDEHMRQHVLLCSSANTRHRLRTPLMAAASTGDMPIVGTVLAALGDVFFLSNPQQHEAMVKHRTMEMQEQLELQDIDGMTLLMHASYGPSPAVFRALSQCVQASQFREVIQAKDVDGMTLLHHAVNGNRDENATLYAEPVSAESPTNTGRRGDTQNRATQTARENLATITEGGYHKQGQEEENPSILIDPRSSVIRCVLDFAREKLWMPEYRKLLQARDGRHRSIIEHAIISGRTQTFEVVFDALRRDIYDENVLTWIDLMLDPGVQSFHAQKSLYRALESQQGTAMPQLVAKTTKNLKNDVSMRKDNSTVACKIQSFIPGNLIVIFQLLLPEFEEDADSPLYLLLVLCFLAPFWSWGSVISTKSDPATQHTRARRTAAKHVLAMPAMFFWGVGTSKIAITSFGWVESSSAAALAVATIVIPALDTYFSGCGARRTASMIIMIIQDLVDMTKRKPSRAARRSSQLYGQNDVIMETVSKPLERPWRRYSAKISPTDTNNMEEGQTQIKGADGQTATKSLGKQESTPRATPDGSMAGVDGDINGTAT